MNDFITLVCPTCGGKLNISSNTTSLVCQNCGNEHLVRREAGNIILESYARCPNCSRNDRVEKVSAIMNWQTSKQVGSMPITQVQSDGQGRISSSTTYRNFTSTERTVLAQRLSPPQQPSVGPDWGVILIVGSIFICGLVFTCSLCVGSTFGSQTNSLVTSLFLCFGLPLLVDVFILIGAMILSKKLSADHKKRLIQCATVDIPIWQHAMDRWNQLYYCYRDDVVFIPNERRSVPIEQMRNLIYQ